MVINKDKCKVMYFSQNDNLVYFTYNIYREFFTKSNKSNKGDLGMTIGSKLSFTAHIEYITNIAMKLLRFIFRNITDFKNIHAIGLLMYTLVRSRVEYASVVWSSFINVTSTFWKIFWVNFKRYGFYPVRHCSQ